MLLASLISGAHLPVNELGLGLKSQANAPQTIIAYQPLISQPGMTLHAMWDRAAGTHPIQDTSSRLTLGLSAKSAYVQLATDFNSLFGMQNSWLSSPLRLQMGMERWVTPQSSISCFIARALTASTHAPAIGVRWHYGDLRKCRLLSKVQSAQERLKSLKLGVYEAWAHMGDPMAATYAAPAMYRTLFREKNQAFEAMLEREQTEREEAEERSYLEAKARQEAYDLVLEQKIQRISAEIAKLKQKISEAECDFMANSTKRSC